MDNKHEISKYLTQWAERHNVTLSSPAAWGDLILLVEIIADEAFNEGCAFETQARDPGR